MKTYKYESKKVDNTTKWGEFTTKWGEFTTKWGELKNEQKQKTPLQMRAGGFYESKRHLHFTLYLFISCYKA